MNRAKPSRFLDLYLIRYVRQRPQLLMALGIGALSGLLTTSLRLAPVPATLIGWNGFTLSYLVMGWYGMARADHDTIRGHAHLYDDGEFAVLLLSIVAAALSMVAIVFLLATVPGHSSPDKAFHTVLALCTLAGSWLFIHTAFAFHYAHGYYSDPKQDKTPPLIFPGAARPLYSDFLYFSFVIGTSAQTADVAMASSGMRRIGLIHCIVAYVFNAAVLGVTINIAASLISGH